MINQDEIVKTIQNQFYDLIYSDSTLTSLMKNYKINIDNEQSFLKGKIENVPNMIYMAIRFGGATFQYEQTAYPFTIIAMSEQNSINVCQRLLSAFAEKYNLNVSEDNQIRQYYVLPTDVENFNEVYNGYRSVFTMSGTFLICEGARVGELIYIQDDGTEWNVERLSKLANSDIQQDTQLFYEHSQNKGQTTKAFVDYGESISTFGTNSFNVTCYLKTNEFCDKVLDAYLGLNKGINTKFKFKLDYGNGRTVTREYRLHNYSENEQIGELTVVSLTFAL